MSNAGRGPVIENNDARASPGEGRCHGLFQRPALHPSRRPLAAVCLLLILAACSGDYEIPLPNGYFITRWSPGQFALVGPTGRSSHSIVVQQVDAYCVDGTVVAGSFLSPAGEPRYFVVDTAKYEVATDLAARDWNDRLRALGSRNCRLQKPRHPLFGWR
jgi:hypothetical protein